MALRYVEKLRRETGFPTVAVAQAWLDRKDLDATLAALAEFDFVRGIRHKPRPGQMTGERWRAASRTARCCRSCTRAW